MYPHNSYHNTPAPAFKVQDLVGVPGTNAQNHVPVGVKVIVYEVEPIENVISVVVSDGMVQSAIQGVLHRIQE